MLNLGTTILDETLTGLRLGGVEDCETVALWLGRRSPNDQTVVQVYRPKQIIDRDRFEIPPESMRELLGHLRKERLQLVAQVHSHPARAFHSRADNEWAIVRHVGALSLVVPWFGLRTSCNSFLDDVACFQLDEADHWHEVSPDSVLRVQT
jgi:proteasome lid subunit RPN8/RPN11